jgi:hypothetical protein
MPLPEPRYVVTELEGYLKGGNGSRAPGLSCTVIDRHENRRIAGVYRSEDFSGRSWTAARARAETRLRAHRLAARLNG